MNLFLSWSGERSKSAAYAFRDFFRLFFQPFRPAIYISSITEKGVEWYEELEKALKKADFGLFLLTRENCADVSPWMMYEAGVLSETAGKNHVMTFLLNANSENIPGPLRRIQSAAFDRNDVVSLAVRMYELYQSGQSPLLLDIGNQEADGTWRSADARRMADALYDHLEKKLTDAVQMRITDNPLEEERLRTGKLLRMVEENQTLLKEILSNQASLVVQAEKTAP